MTVNFLEAFSNATEEDLTKVEERRRELEEELEGVKEAEKVLRKKFGKEEPKKAPATRSQKKPTEGAQEIIRILQAENGQIPLGTLANRLDKPAQSLKITIGKNPKFLKIVDDRVHLLD